VGFAEEINKPAPPANNRMENGRADEKIAFLRFLWFTVKALSL
jgi:hypothetical protein